MCWVDSKIFIKLILFQIVADIAKQANDLIVYLFLYFRRVK